MFIIKALKRDAGAKLDALRKSGQNPSGIFMAQEKRPLLFLFRNIEFKKVWREAGESSAVKIGWKEEKILMS